MGERELRVFVSHSSHAPEALARLKELVEGLGTGESKVYVLYDKRQITEGDQWREVINTMLAECDAAVILITPDALQSPWVLKEATILRWRHDQDPEFKIFVSANIDRTELEKNRLWDPVSLPDIQFVSCSGAAEIAASVKNKLAPLAAQLQPTPLDLLAEEIASHLSNALPGFLQSALNSLDEPIPAETGDRQLSLAYAITRWMLRQPPPALTRIATTLTLLGKKFPVEDAKGILEAVAPMWVELDTASWFVRADWRNPSFRDVAITCKQPSLILQQHVDRAYTPSLPPRVRILNGITNGSHLDDIVRELRNVIRHHKCWPDHPMDDSEIDEYLRQTKVRFYFALPLPEDLNVVTRLQGLYKRVTFVFFTRPEMYPPDKTPPVPAGVSWVVPPLNPELEDEVGRDYYDAMAMF